MVNDDRSAPGPNAAKPPSGNGASKSSSDKDAKDSTSTQVNNIIKPFFRVAAFGILVSASLAGLALAVVPVIMVFIVGSKVPMGSLIACVVSGVALLIATLIAWAAATSRSLKIIGQSIEQPLSQ